MSDMRQGLRAWAEVEGERIARDDGGRVATVRAGIARRRRRRAAVTLASAVVAIGGVGAVAMSLGSGAGLPGSTPPATLEGDVVLTPGDVPAELQCGKPWVLDRGAVRSATAESASASGEWSVASDDGSTTSDTSTIWAGFESLGWTAHLQNAEGPDRMVLSTVVAVRDGSIVGVAPVTAVGLGDGEAVVSMAAPYPGSCGATTVVMPDADYEFHTVVQLVELVDVGNGMRSLATFVDPAKSVTVRVTGLTQWGAAARTPSGSVALVAPSGDRFRAYVVPRPVAACDAVAGQRSQGFPAAGAFEYDVTVPGVQPVTPNVWALDPLVVLADNQRNGWYVGRDAWIVVDELSGGQASPHLAWTEKLRGVDSAVINVDGLALATGGMDPLDPPQGCAYTLPLPTIAGAAFLVVDGVDPAVSAEVDAQGWPASESMTWIYLGQAGP